MGTIPAATTAEERKLQKKIIRKKRRAEEEAAGGKSAKLNKEEKEEREEKEEKEDKKEKKKGKVDKKKGKEDRKKGKKNKVEADAASPKKKGKRFDIGRVIHAFLDSCPLKKASFAQVTGKVLEEFTSVKIQPDMPEEQLVTKINKKIKLNPNINIKNGEIILV